MTKECNGIDATGNKNLVPIKRFKKSLQIDIKNNSHVPDKDKLKGHLHGYCTVMSCTVHRD